MPHRHKLLSKAGLMVFAALMPLFFAVDSGASGEEPPRLEADCNVEIIGEPELNKPFEVVFTFTPNHELIHTKGIPDTAKLRSEAEIEYISGDTLWTGFFERGKTYTLKAWYIFKEPTTFRFKGQLRAMQAKGLMMSVDGYPDIGAKGYAGGNSRLIIIKGDANNKKKKKYVSPTGSYEIEKFTPTGSLLETINRQFMVVSDTPGTGKCEFKKENAIDSNVQSDTNYIFINLSESTALDTLFFHHSKTNFLILSDPDDVGKISGDNVQLQKINDTTFLINVLDDKSTIEIFLKDTTLNFPVKYLSFYSLCGNASYVDNNDYIRESKHVYIRLFNCFDEDCIQGELAGYNICSPSALRWVSSRHKIPTKSLLIPRSHI